MNGWLKHSLSVSLAIAISQAAVAAPGLVRKQIVVRGNENFDATGINDSGVIVGVLYAAITGTRSGVVLRDQTVTTLPTPYPGGGAAQPTSIYDDGTLIGFTDDVGGHELFVLRGGVIDPSYRVALDHGSPAGSAALGVNPLGLVGRRVFFTRVISRELPNQAEYGKPPNFRTVPHLDTFTTIKGLSASGMASGTAFQEMGPQSVFLGRGDQFQSIAPPGAISASGGLSNPAGEVAGSFVDQTGDAHGFTYEGDRYTTFDMTVPASQVTVTAINKRGWVVGTYVSSGDRKQHVFLDDGRSVLTIGTYDPTAGLSVALNNVGQLVISEEFFDPIPKFESFLVSCSAGPC